MRPESTTSPSRLSSTETFPFGTTAPVSRSQTVAIRWTVSASPMSTFRRLSPVTSQNRWGKLYDTATV